MKIFRAVDKKSSDLIGKIVQASEQKFASLFVEFGKVYCPLRKSSVSTVFCELCNFCQGVDFDIERQKETIKCSHNYEKKIKEAKLSEEKEKEKEVKDPEDFKSIFSRSSKKFDDLSDKDILSSNKITSARMSGETDIGETSKRVPECRNSIFDSEVLTKLQDKCRKEELKRAKLEKEREEKRLSKKKQWLTRTQKELESIQYTPGGSVKRIASETESSNPDVSQYKFSVFDNIDEKLKKIPARTEGEMLKTKAEERRKSISRKKIEDKEWENIKKAHSVADITKSFFQKMFEEK